MELGRAIAVRNTKTVYRSGDKSVKLFIENYPKPSILNETLNLARVEEVGLNIPKLQEVTTIDGRWAIVSEYVEGKNLETLMVENPEKKAEYMDMFVKLQLEILSNQVPLLNRIKDKFRRKLTDTKVINDSIYNSYN